MRPTSAGDSFTLLPPTMMDLADETENGIEAAEKDEEDEEEDGGKEEEKEKEEEDHLSRKKGDGVGELESAGIFNLLKVDGLLTFNLVDSSLILAFLAFGVCCTQELSINEALTK